MPGLPRVRPGSGAPGYAGRHNPGALGTPGYWGRPMVHPNGMVNKGNKNAVN